MWMLRHRMWQSGQVFLICSLILVVGFILQIRLLYHNHLKNQRVLEYNRMIREIRQDMNKVERIANSTSSLITSLGNAVNKNSHKMMLKVS